MGDHADDLNSRWLDGFDFDDYEEDEYPGGPQRKKCRRCGMENLFWKALPNDRGWWLANEKGEFHDCKFNERQAEELCLKNLKSKILLRDGRRRTGSSTGK